MNILPWTGQGSLSDWHLMCVWLPCLHAKLSIDIGKDLIFGPSASLVYWETPLGVAMGRGRPGNAKADEHPV